MQSKGGTELEEGEYALSGNGTGAEFLNQMNVGDKVKINTKLTTRTDNLIPIAEQMLTGNALVMREGKLTPRNENEAYNSQTYSRSGIGMSQDGKTLYLIVIDYKSSTSVGTNTATMCYILKQAGAWNVANMDAGGSAQMMLRGKLVNNPADGKERPVSNGFMIFTNIKLRCLVRNHFFGRKKILCLAECDFGLPSRHFGNSDRKNKGNCKRSGYRHEEQ